MNTVKAIDTGVKPTPATLLIAPKINISEIKQIITMCPATMLANRRIIKARGFINIPANSTGIKMIFTKKGENIRNNVAHCFYQTGEYRLEMICKIFLCVLRLGKYKLKQVTENESMERL